MMKLINKLYKIRNHKQRAHLSDQHYKEACKHISKFAQPYKLNVGCGQIKFDGWINIDLDKNLEQVALIWDVCQGFPFLKNQSCSIIYNEHFLEHLTIENASIFLSECYRILQPGGVLRIAMPSLEEVIHKYTSEDWRNQDWLKWPEYEFIQTRAEMINIAFRWWGHQWLYDREELHRRLREAGFEQLRDVEWGSSDVLELRNRETRKDSMLICEALK